MDSEKLLTQFREKARAAFGTQLKAVVVYGSLVRGEFDEGRSDINLLVLLEPINTDTLLQAQKLFQWWLELGYSWPLLFTPDELAGSADAFPMELMDIAAAHRVIEGEFGFTLPEIDPVLHRAQLEHELRSKVLRLRQKAIAVLGDHKALLRLMENSLSTFLVLLRHALLANGFQPPGARQELLDFAQAKNVIAAKPFLTLIQLRQGKTSPKAQDSVQLFEEYLSEIQSLTKVVDRLSDKTGK